jgi:hypothetical protein
MARVTGTSVKKVVSRLSGHLLSASADDSMALAKDRTRAIAILNSRLPFITSLTRLAVPSEGRRSAREIVQ